MVQALPPSQPRTASSSLAELLIEIMGHQGLGWDGDAFSASELEAVRGWLGGKAWTIFGGSQEIQNNIVSKRILGLPDTTASS
jgi:alkylation response protein AidB-like acyl-CoA dehydrogenase